MSRDYRVVRIAKRASGNDWVSLVKYTDFDGNFSCYAVRCSTYYTDGEDFYVGEDKRKAWRVFRELECETFPWVAGYPSNYDPPIDM